MIILGWLVLLLVTLYVTLWAVGGILIEGYFSGKTSKAWIIPVGIAALFWYWTVTNFPFVIAVQ